jgi:hypothetical protein
MLPRQIVLELPGFELHQGVFRHFFEGLKTVAARLIHKLPGGRGYGSPSPQKLGRWCQARGNRFVNKPVEFIMGSRGASLAAAGLARTLFPPNASAASGAGFGGAQPPSNRSAIPTQNDEESFVLPAWCLQAGEYAVYGTDSTATGSGIASRIRVLAMLRRHSPIRRWRVRNCLLWNRPG